MTMWCDLLRNDICQKTVAARGTSCGDKKVRVGGGLEASRGTKDGQSTGDTSTHVA